MYELYEFINYLNNDNSSVSVSVEDLKHYGKTIYESFADQYSNKSKTKENDWLRVSSLGKPAVELALNKLGYIPQNRKFTNKMRHILHTGDMFEAYVRLMLRSTPMLEIVSEQQEIVWSDLGIKGHCDFIVSNRSGDAVLIEVKTMSINYFYNFAKENNDDRGYLTQIAIYSDAVGLPGYFLCLNKVNHEATLIEPPADKMELARARVKRIVPILKNIKSLDDMLNNLSAPPPQEEVVRGNPTGKYKVPPSMQYNGLAPIFYCIEEEKNSYGKLTEYVVGYTDKSIIKEKLEALKNDQQ